MTIGKFILKILFFMALILMADGCVEKIEDDPCLKSAWPQSKIYEIKLAVRVLPTNPILPGSTPGSENPDEFSEMVVNGTIDLLDCAGEKSGFYNLGTSYIVRGVDEPAGLNIEGAYWIGYVVYVYEFGNDEDRLEINLNVRLTMNDGQSYMSTISQSIYSPGIKEVPGELYYYILSDIYSTNWVKV